MKEIEWLAGRGYNILGVTFPAVFKGKEDTARGPFLTVLWENLADPIITGREELGFSKIYCELPEPRISRGEAHAVAGWSPLLPDLYRVTAQTDLTTRNPTNVTLNRILGIISPSGWSVGETADQSEWL